jgi:hypothetical protein
VTGTCGNETSNTATLTVTDIGEPPAVDAWYSAVTHGTAGEMMRSLDATDGQADVETRRSGIQKIIVDFNRDVVATDGSADANDVIVEDSSSTPYTPDSVSLTNGNTRLLVAFSTALPDEKRYTFDLEDNFRDDTPLQRVLTGDTDCEIRALTGDVSGDRLVALEDVGIVKTHNRETVTAGNYQHDVNTDGKINIIDVALTMSRHDNSVP